MINPHRGKCLPKRPMSHPCSTYWTLCLNSPSHGGFNSAVSIGLCVCAEGERWRRYPTSQKVNKPAAQTPQMLTTETVNTLQILSQLRKKDLYARFGGMCRCLYTCDRRKKKKKQKQTCFREGLHLSKSNVRHPFPPSCPHSFHSDHIYLFHPLPPAPSCVLCFSWQT